MIGPLRGILRRAELLTRGSLALNQEGLLYHCPLKFRRRLNLQLQTFNYPFLGFRVPALPHILHVGVTTFCNLSCPACPTGTAALGRRREHLDFDSYRRTVDELGHTLMLMLFWDWGEPFLHPRLPEMIRHASCRGIHTVISTNGNAANGEDHIEHLVSARPSVVIVCVDGADQETYGHYRAGGRLEKVLETARRLAKTRERLRSPYPVIEFRSLAIRGIEKQLPDLLRMARETGADVFSVKSLRPFDYRGTNVDERLVPLQPELSRYKYREGAGPSQNERVDFAPGGPLTCAKPHHSPTLNSDGNLVFCCYATDALECFGNIHARGFRKVWSSAHARSIRRRFSQGASQACAYCYFRGGHRPTILFQVPLRRLPGDISIASPATEDDILSAASAQ